MKYTRACRFKLLCGAYGGLAPELKHSKLSVVSGDMRHGEALIILRGKNDQASLLQLGRLRLAFTHTSGDVQISDTRCFDDDSPLSKR